MGSHFYFLKEKRITRYQSIDQALRCTGAFRAIGRIIGHSILHEGPVIYGLSPAVVQYWRLTANGIDDDSLLESLPLSMQDIPDIDL